ncbi:MAG: hypothetical protein ACLTZI_05770 [[Eubacterium] siraeum]
MEVTAFIIELSAEVVKGIQGGNEYWMMNNGKLRGMGEGMVRGDGYAFEKVVGMERLVGNPSVLRQIGLSKY